MKIGFLGKGGVGKTTLSTLFALHCVAQNRNVWIFDCDVNQGLAERLGTSSAEVPALQDCFEIIRPYLAHQNPLLDDVDQMQKTTPPGRGSRLVVPTDSAQHNFLNSCSLLLNHNLRLFRSGTVSDKNVGHKCHHYSVGAVELIVTHVLDSSTDMLIFDMIAGTDVFSTPLFSYLDLLIIIVEPTVFSIDVYHEFRRRADEFDLQLLAVANRTSDEERAFLINEMKIPQNSLKTVAFSKNIRSVERTRGMEVFDKYTRLISENSSLHASMSEILSFSDSLSIDRSRLRRNILHYHKLNAQSWANAVTGKQLELQIDESFKYPDEMGSDTFRCEKLDLF